MNTGNNESTVKKETQNEMKINVALIIIIGVIIAVSVGFMNSGAEKAGEAYRSAYDESYNNYVKIGYNVGYENFHVKNAVDIQVVDVTKCSNLEVMQVSNFDYAVSHKNDNTEKIDSVFEVTVTGTYCVNMQLSEFIVDNKNKTVTVRVPKPLLTDFSSKYKPLYFSKNGILINNGNYSEGENFAMRQLMECGNRIENELTYNQENNLTAEKMAENTLINVIKQLNPQEPDLKVFVEFDEIIV